MASTKRGDASAAMRVGRAAGVVDQHVEPAEVLDGLGDDPLGVGRLADVGRHEDRPVDLGLVAPAGDDVRPGAGERGHDPGPDPPRAARHHDHPLAEVEDGLGHRANPTAPPRRPARPARVRVGPAAARWPKFRRGFLTRRQGRDRGESGAPCPSM